MQHLLKALAVLGHVDHVGRGADDRHAVLLEVACELERRLPAVLHDDAERLLDVHDLEHVLERQRLEIEAIGGVVISRDGLRIAIDHDRLVAVLAKRHRRMHAAVVELDALSDAIGTAAQHDDLLPIGGCRFALVLVGRIHVSRACREFRGAGVDALVDGPHAERVPLPPKLRLIRFQQICKTAIRKALALQLPHLLARQRVERTLLDGELEIDDFLDLREEPAVDLRVAVQLLERHANAERVRDVPQPLGTRIGELVADLVGIDRLQVEAVDAGL